MIIADHEFNHCRQDWAWVTQPGHIPGRQRALDRYDKGLEISLGFSLHRWYNEWGRVS